MNVYMFKFEDYGGNDWQHNINKLDAEYQLYKYKINELRRMISND